MANNRHRMEMVLNMIFAFRLAEGGVLETQTFVRIAFEASPVRLPGSPSNCTPERPVRQEEWRERWDLNPRKTGSLPLPH